AKRKVLETGVAQDCEVSYAMPAGRVLFALHIEPLLGADNKINGITSAAIDLTRVRALESEQRRLSGELAAALQRYEIALRGSNVTVFTQDRDLRYTSISNDFLGHKVNEIIDHTDEDLVPADSRQAMIEMKRTVLQSGQAPDRQFQISPRQIPPSSP